MDQRGYNAEQRVKLCVMNEVTLTSPLAVKVCIVESEQVRVDPGLAPVGNQCM